MPSVVLNWLNLIGFLISVAVMITILSPIGFETAYSRDQENNGKNNSDGNEWPFKTHLNLVNYVCNNIPTPNFDATDEQLNAAWNLPPKARLSPIMRETARCKMASKWLSSKGIVFNDRKCECVDIWWVIFVFVIAVISSFSSVCWCGCLIPSPAGFNRLIPIDVWRRFWMSLWAMLIWYLGANTYYTLRHSDAGLYYYLYGDMHPRSYYSKEPVNWIIIWAMCLVNCVVEGIKYLICGTAIYKVKKQNGASYQPPVYESLRFTK